MFRITRNINKFSNNIRRFHYVARTSPTIRYSVICSAGLAFTIGITSSKLNLDKIPKNSANESNPSKERFIHFDEVQKHTTSDSCWVIIDGHVYE